MPPLVPSAAAPELQALIERLRAEISDLAAAGDTFACDLRHSWIASTELVLALLDGEREEGLS